MNKWISVKDDLPDDGDEILICDLSDNKHISIGYRRNGYFFDLIDFTLIPSLNVTHWQPLPEPPNDNE